MQSGFIEQGAPLLRLTSTKDFNEQILVRAARESYDEDRALEAIKLYNLAGEYNIVVSILAQALGTALEHRYGYGAQTPQGVKEAEKNLENTATEILRHYERLNRGVGKEREAVVKLLRVKDAVEAKNNKRWDVVLEVGSPKLVILTNV